MLPSGDMIEEDDLSVLVGLYLDSLGAITRGVLAWVDINYFPVTFVSKEKTCVRVCVDSEVGRIVQGTVLGVPVVIREV